jgi:hypothetical protein
MYACRKGEILRGGGMLHSPSSRLRSWHDPHTEANAACHVMGHRVSDRPVHLAGLLLATVA